jgi:hypothetical protein
MCHNFPLLFYIYIYIYIFMKRGPHPIELPLGDIAQRTLHEYINHLKFYYQNNHNFSFNPYN